MAIGIYFGEGKFTPAQYDEAIQKLEAAGAGSPPGRQHHVSMESDGNVVIFDVWILKGLDLDAFGETLMPILVGLGVEPGGRWSPGDNVIEDEALEAWLTRAATAAQREREFPSRRLPWSEPSARC